MHIQYSWMTRECKPSQWPHLLAVLPTFSSLNTPPLSTVILKRQLLISAEKTSLLEEINPDRIRYEVTSDSTVAHLLKSW